MNDNDFWLEFWKILIVGFVMIVMAGMVSCQTTNYRISEVTKITKDPIAAMCALDSNNTRGCSAYMTAKLLANR